MAETVGAWLDRDVVAVAGPDAAAFLQGQLSQDVAALAPGGSAWSFVLQPQGRIDALVRVTRDGDDAFALDVDAGYGEAVAARLRRFLLRTKCEIEVGSDRFLAVRGAAPAPSGALVAGWQPGWDQRGGDWPAGVDEAADGWWERARVTAMWPVMGSEIDEATIPAETGLVALTVSFTKGCFTGQELVARMDARGGSGPRRLRLLRGDAVAVGEPVVDGEAEVGRITSAAGDAALAFLKRGIEPGASLRCGGAAATVEA
jgi:tRNA-modifying protein YgfZ